MLGENFLDELYPKNFSCYNCSAEINDASPYHLCKNCQEKIIPLKNICQKCGDELNEFTPYCDNCKNKKRYFNKAESVTVYENLAKNLVHELKYNGKKYIADLIANYLIERFKTCEFKDKINIVMCVPISHEKLLTRKYNQAEEIAKPFALHYNLDHNFNCLVRIRNTPSQIELTKEERTKNLIGAFAFDGSADIKNKNILIIDDVLTTGSTLDELAKLLKLNGAKQVFCLTFCHTKLSLSHE